MNPHHLFSSARPIFSLALALLLGTAAHGQTILGSAGNFAVMAGSTVTNNGGSTINGDLGAANYAGAGSYQLTGAQIISITPQNVTDFTKAYNGLAAMAPTANLSGLTLGTTAGATILTPGVYVFNSTAQLTGTLTLDAQGQDHAVWVFQIGSTFITAANAVVTFTNLAANAVAHDGVFWQVGSSTALGADTTLEGNVLSGTTFDFGTGATISHGRALTGTGTITLAGNAIDFVAANSGYSGGLAYSGATIVPSAATIPEPAAFLWLAPLSALGVALWRRQSARRL